jgi:uncharacterized protein YndB with AHSA1/START domain
VTDYIPAVTDRDVYITRSFDAPVALVWRFWTEPEMLAHWFGPTGIGVDPSTVEVDARDGGTWNLTMSDDNGVYPITATIITAIENEYLEMNMGAQTAHGDAENVILRIQFHDHGDKTRVTLHQGPFEPEFRDLTRDGWNESFLKLDTVIEAG